MSSRRLCVHFWKASAVVAIGLLGSCQIGCSGHRLPITVGCRISSWTPEVFSFYGDPDKVKAKLNQFDMKLADRRVYMLLVESADSAQLVLFERPATESDSWKIWRWKGQPPEARKFREDEMQEILERKGQDCVGQETKKLLVERLNPTKQETRNPPKTSVSAFGDVLSSFAAGSYIRATVFLLC